MGKRSFGKIMNKSNSSSNNSGSSRGFLDYFTFGVFGVNECSSEDDDWYCKLSRIFSGVIMIIVLACIFLESSSNCFILVHPRAHSS